MNRSAAHTSFLAVVLLSLAACAGTDIEVANVPRSQIEMPAMQPFEPSNATLPIPPIDQEQPTTFETATFALG